MNEDLKASTEKSISNRKWENEINEYIHKMLEWRIGWIHWNIENIEWIHIQKNGYRWIQTKHDSAHNMEHCLNEWKGKVKEN